MIKKFVPYILIAVILVQLFAPFTVGMGEKNNLVVKANKAEAVSWEEWNTLEGFQKAFEQSSITFVGSSTNPEEKTSNVELNVKIDTGISQGNDARGVWQRMESVTMPTLFTQLEKEDKFKMSNEIVIVFTDKEFKNSGYVDMTATFLERPYNNTEKLLKNMRNDVEMPTSIEVPMFFAANNLKTIGGETGLSKFVPGVTYNATLYYQAAAGTALDGSTAADNKGVEIFKDGDADYFPIATKDFTTATTQQGYIGTVGTGETKTTPGEIEMPECTWNFWTTIGGCVGQILYKAVFRPSSALFAITGKLLDVSISYSIKDTSYRDTFVAEGWGLMRDLCNMFFIFILLYIAFSTILNINNGKTKEMIISVVVIGLLINFSLFATQVIIDASNVLTRVFYNESAVVIGEKGLNDKVVTSKTGKFGEIKLSEAIVTKIGPQKLIQGATKVGTYTNASGDEMTNNGVSAGTFILVVLLASAVNIVGLIVFLSVSLIFITRVIGLWIAMILAPLAFFSYTIPAMQGWETVGWKKWWPETIKLAFLAPVFLFFMYLIVKFLGIMPTVIFAADSKSGMDFVVAIMIPFALVMVLMWKAKEIAKDMSGKMGQSITSGIAKVGGVALGAGIGGAALLGRASFGRIANKIGNSGWLNDAAAGKNGKFAQTFGKLGKGMTNYTAKSSFDFRQTKAGNAFSKEIGMNLDTGTNVLGLDTKKGLGGYEGVQKRKVEKENKFGETLGYNHRKYAEVGDEIAEKEKALADYKASDVNHNDSTYKQSVAAQENEINKKKKEQERVKTGRAKEYALTMKRKSGKIYDIDRFNNITEEKVQKLEDRYHNETDAKKKEKARIEYEKAFNALADPNIYRDESGNIKKFGSANSDGARAAKQIMKEFAKGMAQGAATGAVVGSVIPGLGTLAGVGIGTLAGAVRATVNYSGTTNRKVGEESHGDKNENKNNYNPKTTPPSTPKAETHAPAPAGGGTTHH